MEILAVGAVVLSLWLFVRMWMDIANAIGWKDTLLVFVSSCTVSGIIILIARTLEGR